MIASSGSFSRYFAATARSNMSQMLRRSRASHAGRTSTTQRPLAIASLKIPGGSLTVRATMASASSTFCFLAGELLPGGAAVEDHPVARILPEHHGGDWLDHHGGIDAAGCQLRARQRKARLHDRHIGAESQPLGAAVDRDRLVLL